MRTFEIRRQMDASALDEVSQLISDAWRADGTRPLNDHLWLDLREGGRQGFAGVIARDAGHQHILAYCQISKGNESWSLDLVVHPHHRYDTMELAPELIRQALEVVSLEGGGHVHWWVFEPNNIHRQLATDARLRPGRRLLQMRRPLPLSADEQNELQNFPTSHFRVGEDEDAWLAVNNAAFASHPEQGGWSRHTIESREQEPWFNAEGFRMHWLNNELAGFCWTKVHADHQPPLGEIYVIAIHPSMSGHGLGRKMTLAGLHHLESQGITTAMLYVDADNAAAVSVYESLGFSAHHSEHAFVGDIPSHTSS